MSAIRCFGVLMLAVFCFVDPLSARHSDFKTAGKLAVIYFEEPALVHYSGGQEGLEGTAPQARGEARLDSRSPAARAYLNFLDQRHGQYLDALSRTLGRSVQPVFRYRAVRNGMALALSPQEVSRVRALPGVTTVAPDTFYSLTADRGPAWTGAPTVWDGSATGGLATQGEGVVLAVIDTGINMDHPSFLATGGDGFTHTNPNGSGNYLGWCNPSHPDFDPSYPCNDKLIGAWDYTDAFCATNPNICSEQDGPEGSHFHGSHTAGIAAGNVLLDPAISGFAPHANIISYDACRTAFLDQCAFSTISAAIDQAVLDGVDVISLALTGGTRPWQEDDIDNVLLGAVAAGIFVSASAGPFVLPPSIWHHGPWLTTVTASSHDLAGVEGRLTGLSGGSPPSDLTGQSRTRGYGPAPIVYAGDFSNGDPNPGGCESPFPAGTWTDEIVICDRPGTISRVEVCANAAAGGAAGCVLANMTAEQSDPRADYHVVPAVHVNFADGNALRAWLATGSGHSATIEDSTVQVDPALGDIMADTSPLGPNRSFDSLKPDVTAPGVNIFAAARNSPDLLPEFRRANGSSMASAGVAGAALLLRALHPSWSPSEVKSALMLSADLTVLADDGVTAADSFARGAGRIDLERAGRVGLVMDETITNYLAADPNGSGDPVTLNTPSAQLQCFGRCSFSRTFRSVAGEPVTWSISQLGPAGSSLIASPNLFTLAPGATQTVDFTADVSGQLLDIWIHDRVRLSAQGSRGDLLDDLHVPVVLRTGFEDLPAYLTIEATGTAGNFVLDNRHSSQEITDLTLSIAGLTEGNIQEIEQGPDPFPTDPYDNLDAVFVSLVDVPAGATVLVASTSSELVRDIDLYVGTGDTPSAATQICASLGSEATERCTIEAPAPGRYWVLVQNFVGAFNAPNLMEYRVGVVTGDAGNFSVSGPSVVATGTSFDLTLEWNEPAFSAGSIWFALIDVGTDAGHPANIESMVVALVNRGLFIDGFETGDTSRWDNAVP